MIRTKLYLLFVTVVLALLTVGCFEDREQLFEEQVLEWEPLDRSTNALDTTVELEADQSESETITLRMQYAGEQQPEDRTGTFKIHEDTDATEGEHFEVLSDKEVTIPANSSFSEDIVIEIHADNIENGENFLVVLEITDDGDIGPMENYKVFFITIEKGE